MQNWDLLLQPHWLEHDESTHKLIFCLSLLTCFSGLLLASADNVSIASKEASHVVDVKEPKKSKKKVKYID